MTRAITLNLVLALAWAALLGSFTAVDLLVGAVLGFLVIAWLARRMARTPVRVPSPQGSTC